MKFRHGHNGVHFGGLLAAAFLLLFVPAVFGQDETAESRVPNAVDTQNIQAEKTEPAAPATPQVAAPLVDDIQGVSLGMTVDEVKGKLGKPDTSDATSMYYELKNGEQVQLRLDADKKVVMVAGIYIGTKADAPEFAAVLGPDIQAVPQENGAVYRMVRYPDAGYWVSYSRLDLDSGPMTTVTLQKISK